MGADKEEKKKRKAEKAAEPADDDKAAKKAAKKAKKEAEAAAAAGAATTEVDEKAAKKAAKKAKKEAEAAGAAPSSEADEKAAKKAAKKAKREAEEAGEEPKKAEKEAAPEPAAAAEGGDNTRVYVGNLPFSMTDEWITQEFDGIGAKIDKIEWLTHADTGRFKGAGFLTLASGAVAASAVSSLNGKDLEGRPMKVEIATPRKAAAPLGSSDPGEPSENVFVGNLSWSITEDALKATFAGCGEIERIKWLEKDGEFRGIAFVDFVSIEAATKAVALAGTDVMGRPLRINFSKKKENAGGDKWGSGGGAGGGKWGDKPARTERPYKPQGEKPDGCVELFCGNLPWSIDEGKMTTFFAQAGATVTGTRWLNDKETGEFKGIGFVTFGDTADVDKAVGLGGEQLDGRPIRLDYAGNKPKTEGAWGGKKW